MAGINTKGKLEITQLDFDGIKSNLKTYLKGQTEFTDYDFEEIPNFQLINYFDTLVDITYKDAEHNDLTPPGEALPIFKPKGEIIGS